MVKREKIRKMTNHYLLNPWDRALFHIYSFISGKYTIIKNYETSKTINNILLDIINYEGKIRIETNFTRMLLTYKDKTLIFWNSDKYYAWVSEGKVINKEGLIVAEWHNEMPSRFMAYAFRLYIEAL